MALNKEKEKMVVHRGRHDSGRIGKKVTKNDVKRTRRIEGKNIIKNELKGIV